MMRDIIEVMMVTLTVRDVLARVQDSTQPVDTDYSRAIFVVEEGGQDAEITAANRRGARTKTRRDWLVLAELYNQGAFTQKYHLLVYLQFKVANGLAPDTPFSLGRIRNSALRLYVREAILNEPVEPDSALTQYYQRVRDYYQAGGEVNGAPR